MNFNILDLQDNRWVFGVARAYLQQHRQRTLFGNRSASAKRIEWSNISFWVIGPKCLCFDWSHLLCGEDAFKRKWDQSSWVARQIQSHSSRRFDVSLVQPLICKWKHTKEWMNEEHFEFSGQFLIIWRPRVIFTAASTACTFWPPIRNKILHYVSTVYEKKGWKECCCC